MTWHSFTEIEERERERVDRELEAAARNDLLFELAMNICHGSDSESASPADRVRYHLENFPEEWPEGVTQAQIAVVVRWVIRYQNAGRSEP